MLECFDQIFKSIFKIDDISSQDNTKWFHIFTKVHSPRKFFDQDWWATYIDIEINIIFNDFECDGTISDCNISSWKYNIEYNSKCKLNSVSYIL